MAFVGIFEQEFENTIVINKIIISPIFLTVMFDVNIKFLKSRTKNSLFRYFWDGILKQYCHI